MLSSLFVKRSLLAAFLGVALFGSSAFAQYPRPAIARDVDLKQNLNAQIPLDLVFHDESGQTVPLRTYFGEKPVILSLVYFKCTSLCPMSLTETLNSVKHLPLNPGKDYNVLVVSFDPNDTPAAAAEQKAFYAGQFKRAGFDSGFHFLTGSQESISRLTSAVGWRYAWDDKTKQFAHAGGIMVATPEGKLSRYFYGIAYAPQDMRMALVEASKHKIGSPADYILLFCFHYDYTQGKYTLAITRIIKLGAALTLFALTGLIFLLMRYDKKKKARLNWKEVPHAG